MKYLILALSLLFLNPLVAEEEPEEVAPEPTPTVYHPQTYTMMVDPNMSPFAGGHDIITSYKMLMKASDLLSSKSYREKPGFWPGAARWLELNLVWGSIARFADVTQHEVFGHGYRVRDIKGAKVKGYQYIMDACPPFLHKAYTGFDLDPTVTLYDDNIIFSDGLTASEIMRHQMRMDWLESDFIDGRMGIFYTQSLLFETGYSRDKGADDAGYKQRSFTDLWYYIDTLQTLYPNIKISKTGIADKLIVNYIDPFFYIGSRATWQYVYGKGGRDLPMIPFFGGGYIPALRCNLAPHGPEWVIQNYFRTKENSPFYFYAKYGTLGGHKHWGVGLEAPKLAQFGPLAVGCKLDYFDQFVPVNQGSAKQYHSNHKARIESVKNFRHYYYTQATTLVYDGIERQRGGLATLILNLKMSETSKLFAHLGYKTAGYLPGESLYKGPITRGGLSLTF